MSYNTFQPIITNGLVYYIDSVNSKSYPGSGTVCSNLVDGKTASIANGTTVNKHFNFDGIDDYIQPAQFNITSGSDLSMDLVLKISTSQVPYADIFDYDHAGGGFVLQQYYPNAASEWYFYTGSSFVFMTFPTNQFFHLSITKDGSSLKYFINGVEISSSSVSSTITASGKNSRIGDFVGGGRNFNGSISSFKLYNRALTATEVKKNYLAQKTRWL